MRYRNSVSHRATITVLRSIREELGISQVALSLKLKRPKNFASQVENGTRMLNVSEFIQWCFALGQMPSDVLKQIEPPRSPRPPVPK